MPRNLPGRTPVPRIIKEQNKAKRPVTPVALTHKLVEQGPRINRGSRERLAFGESATLVSLQEPGADPTVIGVQLSLITQDPLGTLPLLPSADIGGQPNPVAFGAIGLVEWGTDGAVHSAQFDARDGISLAFLANSLKLSVFHVNPQPVVGTPADIDVFAGVALGSVFPGNIKPQRSVRLSFVGPGSVIIPTPKFARTLDICRAPDTVAVTLEFRQGAFGVLIPPFECEVNVAGGAQLDREITLGNYGVVLLTVSAACQLTLIYGLDI